MRIRTAYQLLLSDVKAAFKPDDTTVIETARRLVREHKGMPADTSLWVCILDTGPRPELHTVEVSPEDPVWI